VTVSRAALAFLFVLSAAVSAGCAPRIGDSCGNASNCSVNLDRACDTTQPGGACTVFDCQPDRCPDDAVCVRFRPVPARLMTRACMRRCGSDGDCRSGDGYRCVGAADLDEGALAEVTDVSRPDARFCVPGTMVATPALSAPTPDAGTR
jgi:hypothetical protein